jgi:hypothetical protein
MASSRTKKLGSKKEPRFVQLSPKKLSSRAQKLTKPAVAA